MTYLLENIDRDVLETILKKLDSLDCKQDKIYVIGNGGSAATASHIVNDLGVGLKRRNIKNFNIESLSDNMSVVTALANDIGYENIFYEQIKDRIFKNDVLIAISCSGNSPNIVNAVKYAKSVGTTVIGLTGFDGGELKDMSDIVYHIQTAKNEYGLVEDLHMIFDHIIYSYYIYTEDKQ